MKTMDLATFEKKFQKAQSSPKMLEALAAQAVMGIVSRIHSCSESIEDAKQAAVEAHEQSSGGFLNRRTQKKTDLLAEATLKTSGAMEEMNALVQESIRYTSVSTALAAVMCDKFQTTMDEGFTDTDNQFKRLNDSGKKTVEKMIHLAQEQIERKKHLSHIEDRMGEKASKINENRKHINANASDIAKLKSGFVVSLVLAILGLSVGTVSLLLHLLG